MKDSYNYSGFSNTLIVSRRGKKQDKKRSFIIEADQLVQDANSAKFYPPYLSPKVTLKSQQQK